MRAIVTPRQRINDSGEHAYCRDDSFRLVEPGDHVLVAGFGWGVVRHLDDARNTMSVELFQGREWIERQHFPEWAMQRKFERVAERHAANGAGPLATTEAEAMRKFDEPAYGYKTQEQLWAAQNQRLDGLSLINNAIASGVLDDDDWDDCIDDDWDDDPDTWLTSFKFFLARKHWWQIWRKKRRPSAAMTNVVDMDEHITTLDPDTSQFQTMLMSLPKSKLSGIDTVVTWLEDDFMPRINPPPVLVFHWPEAPAFA